jgi:hypothetical protein
VRDNQRRSRARHREYVDALRARLARHEREGAQATAEMQRAARAVARENALLRALLAARGVGDGAVREYLRAASAAPAAAAEPPEGKGPVEVAEEGGAGRLARVLAEMERGRGGAGSQAAPAAEASPAAFALPRPQAPGMPVMAPNVGVPVQLLPQLEEPRASLPGQTRERKDSHLAPERPTLPALGLAISAKRYDAIRDCLELPKALDPVAHTDGITN